MDKRSPTLRVIQQMRNEAHRFSLAHHRKRRSKASLHSELDEIKGVGHATKKKLMSRFGSVTKIREANLEELTDAASRGVAMAIRKHFG